MKDFMQHDFDIRKIDGVYFVPDGQGKKVHKNRYCHGVVINVSGETEYVFSNGISISVKENEFLYLPKGSNYEVIIHKHPSDCYAINFEISEAVAFPPFSYRPKNSGNIINYFKSAKRAWDSKMIGYNMKCKSDTYCILYSIKQDYVSNYLQKSKFDIIKPALDLIHERFCDQELTVEEIAKITGVTPEYFRKIFKSFFGITPIGYIGELRIARAKELLENKCCSITDACQMSGYSNMSHFSREFKRKTGIPPSNYKKEYGI